MHDIKKMEETKAAIAYENAMKECNDVISKQTRHEEEVITQIAASLLPTDKSPLYFLACEDLLKVPPLLQQPQKKEKGEGIGRYFIIGENSMGK